VYAVALPSRSEVLEAVSCGKAVIGCRGRGLLRAFHTVPMGPPAPSHKNLRF